jgi:hypothetical protein
MYLHTLSPSHVQLILLFFPLLVVGDFDVTTCCQKAASMNAFVNPTPNITCGQVYEPSKPPAPPALINHTFCTQQCEGRDHSQARNPKKWAAPIVQFILPALIFSMNIPRRLAFLPKRRPKIPQLRAGRNENWCTRISKHLGAQLLSLCVLAVVVVDTLCWVFIILGLASPMMMSGLQEELLGSKALNLVLNRDSAARRPRSADQAALPGQQSSDEGLELSSIKHQASGQDDPEQGIVNQKMADHETIELTPSEQRGSHEDSRDAAEAEQLSNDDALKLIVTVVSGNLLVVPDVVNPREAIIEELLIYTPTWDQRKQRFLSLMSAQTNFGGTIGVPVAFYLGSFVYTIIDLQSNPSDKDTALSLAFGVEW